MSTAETRRDATIELAGRTISKVGYGTMQLERLGDDPQAAIRVVRRAVDEGVGVIDTAHFYGDGFVNDILRRALTDDDEIVMSTKVGAEYDPAGAIPLRPAQKPHQLRAGVEDNLRSLGVEHIDLLFLRRLDAGPGITAEGDQLVALDDQLAELEQLRAEGKIGHIGLSGITGDSLDEAVLGVTAAVQNNFSLVDRSDEPILRACADNGVVWMPFFPLGGAQPGIAKVGSHPVIRDMAAASGITPAQLGLAWLLHHAANTVLVPGTTSIAHLRENLAVSEIELSAEVMDQLDQLDWPGQLD